jgi:dTMP kinase
MTRGRFITFEGIEGVGKSTNMRAFASVVEAAGHRIVTTREPGGTPQAERIREIVSEHSGEVMSDIAELLLIFAARSLHVENVIRPAIESGTWVLCDRFTDSSRAYQGAGRGIPMQQVDELAEWVHSDLWPDATILLDAPVEVGMSRANRRGAPDRFEIEKNEFFARVRTCYLDLAAREAQRFRVVDASRPLREVSADVERIAALLLDKK